MLRAGWNQSGGRPSSRGMGLGQVLAILVALAGLAMTVTGVADFYYSFGMFEPPRYTHWLWIGLPTLAVGLGLCHWTCRDMTWGRATPIPRSSIIKAAEPASKPPLPQAQELPSAPSAPSQTHIKV